MELLPPPSHWQPSSARAFPATLLAWLLWPEGLLLLPGLFQLLLFLLPSSFTSYFNFERVNVSYNFINRHWLSPVIMKASGKAIIWLFKLDGQDEKPYNRFARSFH